MMESIAPARRPVPASLWLMLVSLLCLSVTAQLWLHALPATMSTTPMFPDRGMLPLSFVPNHGQFAAPVQAEARTSQATIGFAATEVAFALPDTTLRLQFQGANADTNITGTQPLPGVVNYFHGNDPQQWRTDVPTYAGITYDQLYPGITLRYDEHDGNVKGTYTVAPGADPTQIQWRYTGAQHVTIAPATGDLRVAVTNDHLLTEAAPVAWQTIDGRQVPVQVHYTLAANGTIGFVLGAYNAAYPLVIDPVLAFSTYLGGSEYDDGYALATDRAGNAYVTGRTRSLNFPTKTPLDGTLAGDGTTYDAFVAKYSAQGTLVYATYLGGTGNENLWDQVGIALDSAGNAYITGTTQSLDFPIRNAKQPTCGSPTPCQDAFVTKLNAQGNALVYSTYLGGTGSDTGTDIAVDGAGNAYVAGITGSPNFPLGNAADTTQAGDEGFVTKYNAQGSAYVFSTYLGGTNADYPAAIALDGANNVYVTGGTVSNDFPLRNPRQATYAGRYDGFVTELSAQGNALVFSTYLGGTGNENVDGTGSIAVDGAGNIYVTGMTDGSDFPTTATAVDRVFGADMDSFVTKYAPGGSALVYSTYLGGNWRENSYGKMGGIAVDGAGNAYVTGTTCSTDFPTKNPTQATPNGCDAFVTQLNAQGTAYLFSTYLGGFTNDAGYEVAVDGAGNVWVVGTTGATDFPLKNATQQTNGGGTDAFVTKISPTANSVKNGGFELDANGDGKPDNWTAVAQVTRSSAQKRTGTYSMRHHATTNSSYVVAQPVTVAAGHTYGFSGWINVPATADAFTFALEVQWLNASNVVVGTSPIKTYTAATNGWNNATATLGAPAGATKASVRMVVTSLNATVYVDDVVVKP